MIKNIGSIFNEVISVSSVVILHLQIVQVSQVPFSVGIYLGIKSFIVFVEPSFVVTIWGKNSVVKRLVLISVCDSGNVLGGINSDGIVWVVLI